MELIYGDGYGYGDGYSYGYGYGYSDGSGYGYGYGYEVSIDRKNAWKSYHYVHESGGRLILRDGREVAVGEALHEDKIEMCRRGLHASLSEQDARCYRPHGAVLTRVAVWGKIKLAKDKLVATDREIIEVVR